VVILAVHWVKEREALKGTDWRGQILIDATNAHVDTKPSALLYPASNSTSSGGYGESDRTKPDNSLQAPTVEGEITSAV
jgi:hypothetical protein